MLYAIKVLLATAFVLGLVKGLSVLAVRYAPSMVVGARIPGRKRLEILESTVLPGGVNLYVVKYRSEELVIASSKTGLLQLRTSGQYGDLSQDPPNALGKADHHEWNEEQGQQGP